MFDRCLYFNVNALARMVNKEWDRAFEPYGLSPAHGYMLRMVLAKPGISQKELAEELRLEKSTITRSVDALQKKGFVTRKRNSDTDARESSIHPTARARSIHNELETLGDHLYKHMAAAIGNKDLKAFVARVREITGKLE